MFLLLRSCFAWLPLGFDAPAAGGVFSHFVLTSIHWRPVAFSRCSLVVRLSFCRLWLWSSVMVAGRDGCQFWPASGGRFWFVSTMRPDSPKNRRFTRLSQKTVICTAKRQNTKKPPFLPRFRVFFWRPAWPSLFWGVHFVQSCQVAGRDGRQASGLFFGCNICIIFAPSWMDAARRSAVAFVRLYFVRWPGVRGRACAVFLYSFIKRLFLPKNNKQPFITIVYYWLFIVIPGVSDGLSFPL